jgi:hypothetical protein
MASFVNLPLDLVPIILQQVLKPSHLASIRLVSRTFDAFAAPCLFQGIFIYPWHKDAKTRVLQLFWTLANCPHLAKWVKKLGQ